MLIFFIRDSKVVIECDGEHWHLNPKSQERDKRKDKLLKNLGYKVFRFQIEPWSKFSDNELAEIVKKKIKETVTINPDL